MATKSCIICQHKLHKKARSYRVEELFDLWQPIKFSQKTIEAHKKQSLNTQLFVCLNCGLEIYSPQIIATSNFYKELQQNEKALYYEQDKWDFHEALKDVGKNDCVMELGCGPGIFLSQLITLTPKIFGTEFNPKAAKEASQKGVTIIKDGKLKAFKNKFDIVFFFHVLEHVGDPIAFLNKAILLIKPGGKICLSVPNQDGPVQYIIPCVSDMPPHHATHWRLKTFEVLAQQMGLKISRFAYEPLIARDTYYYSTHWVNSKIKRDSISGIYLNRLGHSLLSLLFNLTFRLLKMIGKRSWSLIKGQALYIVMEKPKGKNNVWNRWHLRPRCPKDKNQSDGFSHASSRTR